jgi:glutathione S-transferase
MHADSTTLILHQYDTSPFSEKIRKLLAHKRVPYATVEQPSIMPKPDLVPLTGGYRRIPVLQIGADVYCDSQLIARILERRHPTPSIHPDRSEGTCHAWNLWADRLLFLPVVAVVFDEIGAHVPQAFIDDRSRMMPGRDFSEVPKQAPAAREQVRGLVATLETQLADGRPYLLGTAFSLADAACFHPLWFLRVAPGAGALLAPFGRVAAWMERMDALGHGDRHPIAPADALAVARASTPSTGTVAPGEPNGLVAGERVAVVPDDYGFDPVAGTVALATVDEVAVRRSDAAVGDVVVHFPRVGFRVVREAA